VIEVLSQLASIHGAPTLLRSDKNPSKKSEAERECPAWGQAASAHGESRT